jgi:hypothetical protein
MDALSNSPKNYLPNCNSSLFICIFQFDFGCTSYIAITVIKHMFFFFLDWTCDSADECKPAVLLSVFTRILRLLQLLSQVGLEYIRN